MQAIQRFHYDRLQQYLSKLQKESVELKLNDDHLNSINQQEKKLKILYNTYQDALLQLNLLIKQYEKEYHCVRRLINSHKKYRKHLKNKSVV